jgi:hypothetical protein
MVKWHPLVGVRFVLDALKQRKLEAVPTLMPHGEIWEDEIRRLLGPVQISSTRNCNARQDWDGRRSVHLATGYRPSDFETGIEHECCIIQHRNVSVVAENSEFNHWWRIDWPTVGRRSRSRATCSRLLGLLHDLKGICDTSPVDRDPGVLTPGFIPWLRHMVMGTPDRVCHNRLVVDVDDRNTRDKEFGDRSTRAWWLRQ